MASVSKARNTKLAKSLLRNFSETKARAFRRNVLFLEKGRLSEKGNGFIFAYRFIESNLSRLLKMKRGQKISPAEGLFLEKPFITRKGRWNKLVLKVSFKGKAYFVKITQEPRSSRNHLEALSKVERILKKIDHKVNGFTVELIRPAIVFERKSSPHQYFVSEFFDPRQVTLLLNLPRNKETEPLREAIFLLRKKMKKESPDGSAYDIGPHNAFFDKANNKLLLFDVDSSASFGPETPAERWWTIKKK